ncbi:Oidioi.mRNA.OKI2018_I69.PAR.g11705.t1.cds [Oikopleura dioica]|uniref:Oidioi.mRNA.OKI2018_I69.PAR.g11705.t1.cds n=1 Tax=Oikopleura dioica TaxID=34765 RepID=A0ABN7S2N8_OIKDI|nr:Oidioi.mRNA.OKI2018_I69.PAR.g11705.t1.cds [Oikopleura dioica]
MAFEPQIGNKKLVIRNWSGPKKLPKSYENESWVMLEEAVQAIQTKDSYRKFSLERLNQVVANLVDGHKDLARNLHLKLRKVCEDHTRTQLYRLESVSLADITPFLNLLNSIWYDHCKAFTLIINLFLKLDRKSQNGGLWDTGIDIFRDVILTRKIKHATIAGLMKLIHAERKGELIERSLLKPLIGMLSAVRYYGDFETALYEETQKLYQEDSRNKLDTMEVPEYLKYVEKSLEEEEKRANSYLESSTVRPLLSVCEIKLIGDHLHSIASRGLSSMMLDKRVDDLKRLYRIFERDANGLAALKEELNHYVRSQGSSIVVNPEKDSTMVLEMLEFKTNVYNIWKECFNSQTLLHSTIQDALQYIINVRKNRPAELIAKYVDGLMKSGNKAVDDAGLDKKLDEIMSLFRLIHGKDVFEKFYKADLSKRLLHSRSASDDAEKAMLSKLKEECGGQFTQKLEGMFKDIELSREVMVQYKATPKCPDTDIELSVNILTTGNWDQQPLVCNIPDSFMNLQEHFRKFYSMKHHQRKLTFAHYNSSLLIIANYTRADCKPRKHELQVSLAQGIILLLFNRADSLTYSEIKEATNMDNLTMRRQLHSLSCNPKARILLKESKGKEIKESDKFRWNPDFTYKLYKMKINQVQIKETVEENRETTEQIFQDRQLQIDAAIVRIMKSKKTLSHPELMAALFEQLKFPISPPDLKKRIEHLIDRDFIERDPNCATKYAYIA